VGKFIEGTASYNASYSKGVWSVESMGYYYDPTLVYFSTYEKAQKVVDYLNKNHPDGKL